MVIMLIIVGSSQYKKAADLKEQIEETVLTDGPPSSMPEHVRWLLPSWWSHFRAGESIVSNGGTRQKGL